ncbi:MAG: hypothetical protein WCZ17_10915, partial [Candidatus Kapaibacterium sp.]
MQDISPLFAIEAEQLMLAGMTDEAVELCREGLAVFPVYPAAVNVLISSLIASGKPDEANESLDYYKDNLPASLFLIIKKRLSEQNLNIDSGIHISKNEFPDYTDERIVEESPCIDEAHFDLKNLKASNLNIIHGLERFTPSYGSALFSPFNSNFKDKTLKVLKKQSDFSMIIQSLSKSSQIKPESHQDQNKGKSKKSVLVTETIAEILFKQGAYKEAESAYKELAQRFPDRAVYFHEKA